LTLWLTPYIVRKLGTEGYALYSLLGILTGYLMLLTLGAGTATVKYISEHLGRGRKEAVETVLGASFWLHGLGVALGAMAAFAFRHQLAAHFFKVQSVGVETVAWVVACAAGGAVFWALAQCGQSVLQGLQRYDISNILAFFQSAVFLGGAAILLRGGHGVHAIGWLYVATCAALCATVLWSLRRVSPASPSWTVWQPEHAAPLRAFLKFSAAAFISQLAWSAAFQWDRLFIGGLLPLNQLTYYIIPAAILQKLWLIPLAIGSAAFPMLSELHGSQDRDALKTFYRKCSQLVIWVVVPGFVMIMVLAPQFLSLWLGEEFSHYGTWPLRLLAMGYFIHFLAGMPGAASAGLDQFHYAVKASATLAVCCLLLWTILIPRLGIVGAAWGFFLASSLVYVPFLLIVNRDLFGMSWREYLEEVCMRPFAAGAGLTVVLWLIHGRLYTWSSFLFTGALCATVYFSLGVLLLDRDSYDSLKHIVAILRERLVLKAFQKPL